MYKKVRNYIEKYQMLEGIDYVAVGLSGGADSVCLLFMLIRYIRDLNRDIHLLAVHVHHGIRGEAADKDAHFCRELCGQLKVEYRQYNYDVPALAEKEHISLEEMGRKLRYEAFRDSLPEGKRGVIAVAHHQNDQAETVLFHLARGSFLKGSRGMEPVHENVIRPLLCVDRTDIEEWAARNGRSFCTDATNYEENYTRNCIRLKVIPYLKEHVNEESVHNICRFADRMAELRNYMDAQAEQACKQHVRQTSSACVLMDSLQGEHRVIQKMVAHRILVHMGAGRDIEEKHIEYLLALYANQCGRRINLPRGITAKRVYDGIRLELSGNNETDNSSGQEKEETLLPGHVIDVIRRDDEEFDRILKEISKKNIEDHYTKFFDYDRICNYILTSEGKNAIVLRHRRPGDYMVIDGFGHRKKVKEILVDAKIPSKMRGKLWLFAIENRVLWIVGVRGAAECWVDEETSGILKLAIEASAYRAEE